MFRILPICFLQFTIGSLSSFAQTPPKANTVPCVSNYQNDSVTVFMVPPPPPPPPPPGDDLIIYNTFTPNEDGVNDCWYIGNIGMYPKNKVEIYNRNGKLVYMASPYMNNWNGKTKDINLPAATYYYVIDTGIKDKEKIRGAVTIIR